MNSSIYFVTQDGEPLVNQGFFLSDTDAFNASEQRYAADQKHWYDLNSVSEKKYAQQLADWNDAVRQVGRESDLLVRPKKPNLPERLRPRAYYIRRVDAAVEGQDPTGTVWLAVARKPDSLQSTVLMEHGFFTDDRSAEAYIDILDEMARVKAGALIPSRNHQRRLAEWARLVTVLGKDHPALPPEPQPGDDTKEVVATTHSLVVAHQNG